MGKLLRATHLALFFNNAVDLTVMQTLLTARLAQFGLSISEQKTHQTKLGIQSLSAHQARRRMTFLGFTIFRAKNREGTRVINSRLRGHFNYYGIAGNGSKLKSFYHQVQRDWRHTLSRRSQNGRVDWSRFTEIAKRYPLVLPKIKIQYQDLSHLVRL